MPDLWLPGAIQRPGLNAGYRVGRSQMRLGVCHFTVGTDSTPIGDRGYFNILFPKVGPPIQFAETDAVTWHAAEYNPYGPGAEWERLPTGEYVRPGLQRAEPLTADQIVWGGRWVDHCAEWGIPKVLYDGPRFEVLNLGFSGQVNHGDLSDQRSDGLTPEEWALIVGGSPASLEDDVIYRLTADIPNVAAAGSLWGYTTSRWIAVPGLSAGVAAQDIDPAAFTAIRDEQEKFRNLLNSGGAVSVGTVGNPVNYTVSLTGTATPT